MITYYEDVVQGSEEWLALRCGVLTASEMHLILTPTLKIASNEKERAHVFELLAQRIQKYVEPRYVSDDMLRGNDDEIRARALYAEHFAPIEEVGFVTNDVLGFPIGYSPDGLVGDDGQIECKSRRQRFQIETIISGGMPLDYLLQVQTGLSVTERKWCDFISYSGGLPMAVYRVFPDGAVIGAILEAATAFEGRVRKRMAEYYEACAKMPKLIPTERHIEQEMHI